MDEEWHRLSIREGRRVLSELREDFSPQATRSLVHWLEGEFGYRGRARVDDQLVMDVALICDVDVDPHRYDPDALRQLLDCAARDDVVMLDVLDATLRRGARRAPEILRSNLEDARSVWTVNDDGTGLVRRVARAAGTSFARATTTDDEASADLAEAWSRQFGRSPDPSDAWDHAIKAMESVLVPIVAPRSTRATLGTVIAELEKEATPIAFALGPAAGLAKTLRFAWPNPDRHGGGRTNDLDPSESGGVVQLAVAVVQWARDGLIRRTDR